MLKFQWLQGDFSAPHEDNEAICIFIHTPVNQVHCLYCTLLVKSCCCGQARDECRKKCNSVGFKVCDHCLNVRIQSCLPLQ